MPPLLRRATSVSVASPLPAASDATAL